MILVFYALLSMFSAVMPSSSAAFNAALVYWALLFAGAR